METEEERFEFVERHVNSDLKFVWVQSEVSEEDQYALAFAGYKSVRKFVGFAEDRRGARTSLKDVYHLDGDTSPANNVRVASVIDAWESAVMFRRRENEITAEAHASRVPAPVDKNVRTSMKKALEVRWGKRPPAELPAEMYVAKKFDEIEKNDPQAGGLDEVVSLEDDPEVEDGGIFDNTGNFKLHKKLKKGKMPTTFEELRSRLRCEGNLWVMASLRHVNRRWLKDLEPRDWDDHIDYILSKKVGQLQINVPDDDGVSEKSLKAPFQLVLKYEREMRKWAFEQVTEEGKNLRDALIAARKNTELKELHFTTNLPLLPRAGDAQQKRGWDSDGLWQKRKKTKGGWNNGGSNDAWGSQSSGSNGGWFNNNNNNFKGGKGKSKGKGKGKTKR